MTTTTDFLSTEAPAGIGAGGDSPRRLIPSRFHRAAATREPQHWTTSLLRVVTVLTISAAAGIGVSVTLDHTQERREVLAPVHLPPPSANAHHGTDVSSRPVTGSELFE